MKAYNYRTAGNFCVEEIFAILRASAESQKLHRTRKAKLKNPAVLHGVQEAEWQYEYFKPSLPTASQTGI